MKEIFIISSARLFFIENHLFGTWAFNGTFQPPGSFGNKTPKWESIS
ncbi:MAG: hypothetical protein IKA65_00785 [Lentisphaeria bacterium]|nr:hypothetical protein [Lentisphaeria bacterium]